MGARWCVLGLICWEKRRQGAEVFHKARSVSPGSWALGMGRQEPPVHTRRSHTCWDLRPAQPSIARSKPRPRTPQAGQSRGPQSRLQRRGSQGGKGSGGTGPWSLGRGWWARALSGEAVSRLHPGHTPRRRLTSGKRSLHGGMGSPEPPSLAQPCAGRPAQGLWPAFSGFPGCVASAPAGSGCVQASAARGSHP